MNIKDKLNVESLHWTTQTVLYGTLTYCAILFACSINLNDQLSGALIDMLMYGWGAVSVLGMLKLKQWGLVSFLIYRATALFASFLIWETDGSTDPAKDAFYLIVVLLIFLIKKDGHNAYEVFWKNGNVNK